MRPSVMVTKAQARRRLPPIERKGPKPRSHAAIAEQWERTTGRPAEGRSFGAFEAQQRGEAPSNGNGKDAQPGSAGPRGSARMTPGRRVTPGAGKMARSLDRRARAFLRLGTANPRHVLMVELVAVLVVQTVDQLSHGQVPEPRVYLGAFVVYLVLGFAAELGGDGAARIAVGFGALVLVALVMVNAPGIVRGLGVASGQRRQVAEEGVG